MTKGLEAQEVKTGVAEAKLRTNRRQLVKHIKSLVSLCAFQEQRVEYDEEAIRDQIITTIKSVKVVEWLKDNVKRNVLPWNSSS